MTKAAQPIRVRFFHDEGMGGVFPNPIPATKAIPKYFKDLPASVDGTPLNLTAKRCMPFLDAMSAGFIIPLWADMFVQTKGGNITVTFPKFLPMHKSMDFHDAKQLEGHPLSKLPYGNALCKIIGPWLIQTDPGVSCLFTSPLNHMETRFKILDGIVDTDTYYNNINFPFVWTEGDGEFLVQKGTPFIHVIPFRREEQVMEVGTVDVAARDVVRNSLGTVFQHGYRTMFRHGAKASTPDEDQVK